MVKARELFEAHPDEPEDFDVQGHLESPIARIARTNGFVRDDRNESEERWVKKLRNGNAAWLRSRPYDPEEPARDMRDPTRLHSGGRHWELIEVGPKGLTVLASGNEVTMTYLLGAFMQRLATWPKGLPKPGQRGWKKAFENVDEPPKEHIIHMGRPGECKELCPHCGAYCTLLHYNLPSGVQMPTYHICQTCDLKTAEVPA